MDLGNIDRIVLQLSSNILGLVFLVLAALIVLLFAGWVLYMFWSGLKMLFRREPVPDRNHPAKVQVSFGDTHITLERRWSFSKSRWEYVLMGELPYRAIPPDHHADRTMEGLTMGDARAMKNLEVLIESGAMDETIKAAYATIEAQGRQEVREKVGRIVSGEKKGHCALDPP